MAAGSVPCEGNRQEATPEKAGTPALGQPRGWRRAAKADRVLTSAEMGTENLRVALTALSPNRLSYIAIAASMSSRC